MPALKQTRVNGSNQWLSQEWFEGKNDEEIELQKKVQQEINALPNNKQNLQLEHIYRQMALLNYLFQTAEARKVPGDWKCYTIQLNLLGASFNKGGGGFDQILRPNPARKRLIMTPTNSEAIVSYKHSESPIQTVATVGSLVMLDYFGVGQGQSTPIHTTGGLFGISNSPTTNCVLTIVEELYRTPVQKRKADVVEKEMERLILNQNWLDRLVM